MRRSIVLASLLAIAGGGAAHAQEPADVARALAGDPIYVHPAEERRLSPGQAGRVRLAIVRNAIGRIKIAVVPAALAREWGGVGSFAQEVDKTLDVRGAFLVVARDDFYVVTSYPNSESAAAAVRRAVAGNDPLPEVLVKAVRELGEVDPGGAADIGGPVPSIDTDDLFDDIGDAFKLGALVVALAIALPFVLFALFLVVRYRRRAHAQEETRRHGERTVRDQLVELGDGIRALDLDTSMPDADRAGLAEYEQAIARYDQANDLLLGEPSAVKVDQARAAIGAGLRHLAAARARLGANS